MPLTDAACRSAKSGRLRKKLSDGGGLQLWIQPSGARLWQLAYRFRGQQRQLALGPYPSLSLAGARSKRDDIKRLLRDGGDPIEVFRKQPLGDTFQEVAQEYVAKRKAERLADVTLRKKEWLLQFAYRRAKGSRKRATGSW